MSALTIKDVPTRLHRELKARAKVHGRSLNREIIATLEAGTGATQLSVSHLLQRAQAIRAEIGGHLTPAMLLDFKSRGRR